MKKLSVTSCAILALCMAGAGALEIETRNGVGASFFTPTAITNSNTHNDFLGGLSYQHWFSPTIGIEFGGAINGDNSSSYNPLSYNAYIEFDYSVFQFKPNFGYANRLFIWGLAGHHGGLYSIFVPAEYDTDMTVLKESYYADPTYIASVRAGLGVGFEFIFASHISLPIKLGFTASYYSDNYMSAGFTFGSSIKYLW